MSEDVNRENLNAMMRECTSRVQTNIANCVELYNKIKWETRKIVIPTKPKPSQRPRLSGSRIYVPGAAKAASYFNKNVMPKYKSIFITTPCLVDLDIYVETPASFTATQQALAEMKILRPWTHTGDVDNYTKSALDCIQPNKKRHHRGIMCDDCLIIDCISRKYYSITPRYEMTIRYMTKIPKELLSIMKLKTFIDYKPED